MLLLHPWLPAHPAQNHKLLFGGNKASARSGDTLNIFGLKDGTKVQITESAVEETGGLRVVGDVNQTERAMRKGGRRVTFTGSPTGSPGCIQAVSRDDPDLQKPPPSDQAEQSATRMLRQPEPYTHP